MSQEDSNREKSTKIFLTGDKETCGHCKSDDEKLQQFSNVGYTYEYTDVNSDKGQQQLKDWGVQEGQSIDIPVIKAETCSWDPKNPTDKKCKTSDWKHSYWSDIESGKLPDEVTDV